MPPVLVEVARNLSVAAVRNKSRNADLITPENPCSNVAYMKLAKYKKTAYSLPRIPQTPYGLQAWFRVVSLEC